MPGPSRLWFSYGIALASALAALATSLVAWPLFQHVPYMPFFFAVFVAARVGGTAAGLPATGLAAAGAWYFLIPPRFSLELVSAQDTVGLVGFLVVAGLITAVTGHAAASELHFRRLLEAISEGFATFGRDGRCIYVNARGAEFAGRRPQDLIGRTVAEAFPGLEDSPAARALREVLRHRVPRQIEAEYRGRWFQGLISPSEDGASVLVTEVTEQRAAAERERRDQERLKIYMEAAKIGGWEWDIRSNRVEWTPRIYEIHGLPPGSFGGTIEEFSALVHPEDRPRVEKAVVDALAGQSYEIEYRILRPSGETRWLYSRGEIIAERGQPARMIGVTLDMTELMRAREETRAAEQRFQLMADVAPVKIWIHGPDRLASWFNQRWLRFRGRTLEEEMGSGWTEGVHPDDLPGCLEAHRSAFESRTAFETEYRLRRRDGEYRWIVEYGVPYFGAAGEFAGFLGSCLDITERKQVEQERESLLEGERRARREAEHANRLKDEFLATISHELRTPLQSVLGWARLLRTSELDASRRIQALESIERGALAQAQLIEDLLDMSRIVTGRIRLDVQRVDMAPVIEAAIETVRPAAEAKGLVIRRVLDPLAGPVNGDPQRLQQVLWNLLSNAVKFTPRQGSIEVLLERVNSHVEISVTDSGQGIAPEFLPFVFDAFRQQDGGTTRRHYGLGLGLAIVRHLVELHGGTVRVSSPGEGQGATFRVALPLSVVHGRTAPDPGRHHPATPLPAQAESEEEEVSLEGLRVLVVEDEEDSREILRNVLERRGAQVLLAGSAREGLQCLEKATADVIVSDIGMPDMDGFEFMRRVRSLPADRGGRVPAIALTAFARPQDRTRALVAGYQVHVAKPVRPDELVALVHSLSRAWNTT